MAVIVTLVSQVLRRRWCDIIIIILIHLFKNILLFCHAKQIDLITNVIILVF